jgi:hypothetical protein
MAFSAYQPLWLTKDRRRRERHGLYLFLSSLRVLVEAGFDLPYAWERSLSELSISAGSERTYLPLLQRKGPFGGRLESLAREFPMPYRIWFGTLAELYASGSSLLPCVLAFSEAIEREVETDWQRHVQGLPLKISLVLAFFFVLPAMAMVLLPLVQQLESGF